MINLNWCNVNARQNRRTRAAAAGTVFPGAGDQRVQGVPVGDRQTLGPMAVDDDIFRVRDWRRDGSGPRSPAHSKRLTALYFSGALSARRARHRPG